MENSWGIQNPLWGLRLNPTFLGKGNPTFLGTGDPTFLGKGNPTSLGTGNPISLGTGLRAAEPSAWFWRTNPPPFPLFPPPFPLFPPPFPLLRSRAPGPVPTCTSLPINYINYIHLYTHTDTQPHPCSRGAPSHKTFPDGNPRACQKTSEPGKNRDKGGDGRKRELKTPFLSSADGFVPVEASEPVTDGRESSEFWSWGKGIPRQGLLGKWGRELEANQPILVLTQPEPSPSLQLDPPSTAHPKIQNQGHLWSKGTAPSSTGTWCFLRKDPRPERFLEQKDNSRPCKSHPGLGPALPIHPLPFPDSPFQPWLGLSALPFPLILSSCLLLLDVAQKFLDILQLQFQQGEPQGWHSWQSSPHHPTTPETPQITQLEQPGVSLRLQRVAHAGTRGKETEKPWNIPGGAQLEGPAHLGTAPAAPGWDHHEGSEFGQRGQSQAGGREGKVREGKGSCDGFKCRDYILTPAERDEVKLE
ncbi:PREDICTED: uncharacterized protein LOC106628528 [Pseudopodoces humilis]|uniref:uncharacterized protein LOC106628528 n=1 Tax=Pseudopodoces humilis TaxID=181119 RepID=UPI0006B7310D|nr:PREDICTED: uncharacterized protein LOC106628528 [Pseudopodoces humilis]